MCLTNIFERALSKPFRAAPSEPKAKRCEMDNTTLLPLTASVVLEAALGPEERKELDNLLASSARTWVLWHSQTQQTGMAAEQLLSMGAAAANNTLLRANEERSVTDPSAESGDDE